MAPKIPHASVFDGPPERTLPGRNSTKPDVHRYVDGKGLAFAVKDYRRRPAWLRRLWARRAVAREARALEALASVPGVVRVCGTLGPERLVTRWIDGRLWRELPVDPARAPARISALEAAVRGCHEAGVAHGDLHGRDVLVDGRDAVHLLDFATAAFRGGPAFRRFAEQDRVAVARLSAHLEGCDPDAAVDRLGADIARRWRRARAWKRRWDRLRGRTA